MRFNRREMIAGLFAACVMAAAATPSARSGAPECVTALDCGGVSFDFESLSERRFAANVSAAGNLLKDVRACEPSRRLEVPLPDSEGGEYVLSGRFRLVVPADVRYESHRNGGWRVFYDGKRGEMLHFLLPSGDFAAFAKTLRVPNGVRSLALELTAGAGCALSCTDLTLVRKTLPPVVIELLGMGSLDGTFAVSPGQLGLVMFTCRKAPGVAFDGNGLSYRVRLPKGIEFVDTTEAVPGTLCRTALSDGSERLTFAKSGQLPIAEKCYYYKEQRGLLVRGSADLPPDVGVGDGLLELYEGNRRLGGMTIRFRSVAPVSAVKPKGYFNGIDFGHLTPARFVNRDSVAAYFRSLSGYGVDAVIAQCADGSDNDRLHAAGIRRVLPRQDIVRNGYLFGPWEEGRPPADVRYVAYPETDDGNVLRYGVCPQAVYGEHPVVKGRILSLLSRVLKGADGMWANWEPCACPGCYCDKCRRLFETRLNLPADALKDEWPAVAGRKYRREYAEFQSGEHAAVVRTVDRWIRSLTGGAASMGFVPGIEWADMSSCWREENLAASYRPIAYAGDLEWINPWGPYGVMWATAEPYAYLPNRPMAMFWAASDLRAQADADYPPGRRPRLMAYPFGCSDGWAVQPEALAMALDSCFFNRWSAAAPWFFPMGADARYWRAFADATSRAAAYEGFVSGGRDVSAEVSARAVPEFAPPCTYGTRYLPKSAKASLLQTRAYEMDATRIVAVFNFWEKGEAFLTLSATGLAAGRYRLTDEKGVVYARSADVETWTDAELARGVLLEVGAMRTHVFEIVPDGRPVRPAKAKVTSEEMRRFYEARRRALEEEAKRARAWEKLNPTPPRDWMPVV